MKWISAFLLFTVALDLRGQTTPTNNQVSFQFHPSLGVAFINGPTRLNSSAQAQRLIFQLESGNRWFVASEILLSAFRSADLPNKKGLLNRDYPRVNYSTMGIRIGKGFLFSDSLTVFQGSVGINSVVVSEPIGTTNGLFGPVVDSYKKTASIALPIQADLVWHLRKKKAIAFTIGLGWYFGNQSFGVLSTGIKMRLYASKD